MKCRENIEDGTRFTRSHWMHYGLKKPIILVDFDHTITTTCLVCAKDMQLQKGVKEALTKLRETFEIWIFTGNYDYFDIASKSTKVRTASEIEQFLKQNGIPFDRVLQIKPPACFIVDDRAIHHTSWKRTLKQIEMRLTKGEAEK